MRRGFFVLACAVLAGTAACGGGAGCGAKEWKAVAEAAGAARTERIARAVRAHEGALGTWLDESRRGDAEFAATEAAAKAAAEIVDGYRPGKPDPTLVS